MNKVDYKNYSDVTAGQRLYEESFKALAWTLLAASIIAVVYFSAKAELHSYKNWEWRPHDEINHAAEGFRWVKHWTSTADAYTAGAVLTSIFGVIPSAGLLVYRFAHGTNWHPKTITEEQLEDLKSGDFDKVRDLLFKDTSGKFSKTRMGDLVPHVRNGLLTPEDVTFFDTTALALHKKMLAIEEHKAKKEGSKDFQAKLEQLEKEEAALQATWQQAAPRRLTTLNNKG